MQNKIFQTLGACVFLAFASQATAAQKGSETTAAQSSVCNNATIAGRYLTEGSGQSGRHVEGKSVTAVHQCIVLFDGKGNFQVTGTSVGGGITHNVEQSGTYVVAPVGGACVVTKKDVWTTNQQTHIAVGAITRGGALIAFEERNDNYNVTYEMNRIASH